MIICEKCKKWEDLKIVTPYDKEGYWMICENCKFEKKLQNTDKTKRMFDLHDIYVQCLSHRFVYGEINMDDIKKLVWEKISQSNRKKK